MREMNSFTRTSETKRKNQDPCSQTQQTKLSQSMNSPVGRILHLQRTIGNQAVQRLMRSGTLQAKLRIGAPDDVYEQEADRVADAVMRMPKPHALSSSAPCIQRVCPKCEEEELKRQPIKEEDEELQAKATSGSISEVNPDFESHIQFVKGSGQPLSPPERAFFEPRFGADFGNVRVHNDTRAACAAQSVNARAFTLGNDVMFGAGQYSPGTSEGRHLLAHELTHVVQQHGSVRLQRAAAPTGHEEMLDTAINIVQRALDSLTVQASENEGQPVAAGNMERDQNLRKALDNLLALKGSGKEEEILRAVQPILFTAKSNTTVANPNATVQRKPIVGHEGDHFEREAEVVVRRMSHGCTDSLIHDVSQHSTEIIQRQGGPGEAVLVGGAVASGPPGWAILAGIAIVGLIVGGVYLATRPRSRPCPPCPANPPPEIDRVPPSTPHFPCPGDHWHYRRYNQNPETCECFLSGRLFGGCCGWPGAPC